MIDNSQSFWYCPEIKPELIPGLIRRMELWSPTYYSLWYSFGGLYNEGENVTGNMIEAAWAVAYPEDPPYSFPADYIVWNGDVWNTFMGAGFIFVPLDEPEPEGQAALPAMVSGMILWQNYRMALALQGNKLSEFHRRGRRDIV